MRGNRHPDIIVKITAAIRAGRFTEGNGRMEIEWNEDCTTNVAWIDSQHKNIIHNIKIFVEAAARKKASQELKKAMAVLNEFVENHFKTEESYMERYRYPQAKEHRAQHANYAKVIEILLRESEATPDSPEFLEKVKTVLMRYFDHHIPNYDKPFAEFLREHHNQ